jgi:hypothetical protein
MATSYRMFALMNAPVRLCLRISFWEKN